MKQPVQIKPCFRVQPYQTPKVISLKTNWSDGARSRKQEPGGAGREAEDWMCRKSNFPIIGIFDEISFIKI